MAFRRLKSAKVYYYKNNDIDKNHKNGISKKIKSDYYEILKKYDKLDYYTFENFEMIYDSKENLDENYNGSLCIYSRG